MVHYSHFIDHVPKWHRFRLDKGVLYLATDSKEETALDCAPLTVERAKYILEMNWLVIGLHHQAQRMQP